MSTIVWSLLHSLCEVPPKVLHTVYDVAIIGPFRRLYFLGPEFNGFGFWQGRPSHEICCIITGVSGDLWMKNTEECEDLLNRKFTSFVVLFEAAIYLYLVYKAANIFITRFLFVNPLLSKIDELTALLTQSKECPPSSIKKKKNSNGEEHGK
jgi:hypothetical protein